MDVRTVRERSGTRMRQFHRFSDVFIPPGVQECFILMPRKATKTEKPSLPFLERPLCGARLQNVPEVRAALNPREFFTETQTHNSSALTSWVSCLFSVV